VVTPAGFARAAAIAYACSEDDTAASAGRSGLRKWVVNVYRWWPRLMHRGGAVIQLMATLELGEDLFGTDGPFYEMVG
jgi:hypothetical protein